MRQSQSRTRGPIEAAFAPVAAQIGFLCSEFAANGRTPAVRRTLFLGPEGGEGSSTVCAGLAVEIARNLRTEVVLVEANLQSPSLASRLSLSPYPGLADVLCGEAPLDEAIRSTEFAHLRLLPAGGERTATMSLLHSPGLRAVLEELGRGPAHVLLDGPALLRCPESRILLSCVDDVVLVARAGVTSRSALQTALSRLERAHVAVAGVVLNAYEPLGPRWLRFASREHELEP